MYLQIKKITTQKSKYGNDLLITMIGLYQDDGKRVKWIKLDDSTATMLTTMPIKISDDGIFR